MKGIASLWIIRDTFVLDLNEEIQIQCMACYQDEEFKLLISCGWLHDTRQRPTKEERSIGQMLLLIKYMFYQGCYLQSQLQKSQKQQQLQETRETADARVWSKKKTICEEESVGQEASSQLKQAYEQILRDYTDYIKVWTWFATILQQKISINY